MDEKYWGLWRRGLPGLGVGTWVWDHGSGGWGRGERLKMDAGNGWVLDIWKPGDGRTPPSVGGPRAILWVVTDPGQGSWNTFISLICFS